MPTIPYLHFDGQCAEALAFYAEALGATGLAVMRYSEAPYASEEMKASDRIMHGQITIGTGTLMASDMPPGMEGGPHRGVSIMQTFPTLEEARSAFDRLSEGGEVVQPFAPTFFSPGFGMLKDRFGAHWLLSTELAPGSNAAPDPAEEAEAHPT